MSNLLDISIHGPQRVAIVEQLVHICRYTPGLVLLEGDAGKSPVNFLRHMADLLRDELDFALLDSERRDLSSIAAELIAQWFIYQAEEHEQTVVQSVHHYLDLGLQSGRLALIVIERSSLLTEEAIDFLVAMMARHSRLTILFAGIVDVRPLLRKALQAEVPVHRIDLHDSATPSLSSAAQSGVSRTNSQLSASGFDHTFSDDSYELPEDDDVLEDDLYEPEGFATRNGGRREPVVSEQYAATQSSVRINASDSMFGASTRLSAAQAWGAATLAGIKGKKYGGGLLLACLVLVVLFLLFVLNSQNNRVSNIEQSVVGADSVTGSSSLVKAPVVPPASSVVMSGSSGSGTVNTQPNVSVPPPSTPVVPAVPVSVEAAPASPLPPQPALQERVAEKPVQAQPLSRHPAGDRPVSKSKPAASGAPVTEKYWRARPENFTVQVAAAHGETNIRQLEKKLPPNQPHYVYRTTRDGKPWFILIYGSFSSKKAASSARDSIAMSIRKDSTPWVRKQAEVFAQ